LIPNEIGTLPIYEIPARAFALRLNPP
jgi:hypothetical protein